MILSVQANMLLHWTLFLAMSNALKINIDEIKMTITPVLNQIVCCALDE